MKKIWFSNVAIALGLLANVPAMGQQYQAGYGSNYGPSSFPVQLSGPQQSAFAPQSILQNIPQVPPQYAAQGTHSPYQFVSNQDQVGDGFGGGIVPEPIQAAPLQTYAPQAPTALGPHAGHFQPAPQASAITALPGPHSGQMHSGQVHSGQVHPGASMSYTQQQVIAPGCSSCGPAPFTQPNYGYNSDCTSCPAPVAFNAPSPFQGGFGHGHGLGGGHGLRGGHFAGGNGFGGGGGQLFGGLPVGAKPWFFGGGFLRYNRIDDHKRPLTLRDSNSMDVLSTSDAQMNAMNGFEIMGGRYFNCGKNAIQASYWGLFPDQESAMVYEPGGVFRSRILGSGDADAGVLPDGNAGMYDVYDWYDNAVANRVTRSSEFHNVEVNLLGFAVGHAARNFNRPTGGSLFAGTHGSNCGYCGGAGCGACGSHAHGGGNSCAPSRFATGPTGYLAPPCGSRLNLNWLAGFRYFSFDDNLQYAADLNGDGVTRAVDDFYYDVNTTNDLVGFQIGGRGDFCLGRRINVYGLGKVGVYNNRATLFSRMGTDTAVAYDTGMPTARYNIMETDNRVAFLSELGTGIGYRISPKWTANFGYSVIAASGVATSVGNVRSRGDFVRDQRHINNQDTLILHGFNLGALYNF